jgi:hypothetical protein
MYCHNFSSLKVLHLKLLLRYRRWIAGIVPLCTCINYIYVKDCVDCIINCMFEMFYVTELSYMISNSMHFTSHGNNFTYSVLHLTLTSTNYGFSCAVWVKFCVISEPLQWNKLKSIWWLLKLSYDFIIFYYTCSGLAMSVNCRVEVTKFKISLSFIPNLGFLFFCALNIVATVYSPSNF